MDELDDVEEATILVPRRVRFPVELRPPPGFDPERPETWPAVDGRLEYVEGKLLYMPPCGGDQAETAVDVVVALGSWLLEHRDFVARGNEAGIRLGRDTRGADVGIWRAADLSSNRKGYARVPPLLAIEVTGVDDTEEELRHKASWYLAHGVATVWIVVPAAREVIVIAVGVEERVATGRDLPEPAGLPGLTPAVASFFRQVSRP